MKRLIFTLLFCLPLLCFGQATLQLKHDTTNVWVGVYQHPLNTLRARFLDTDSTLAIWGTDNTVFAAARRFNNYTDDAGIPFASYAALKAYVRQYFFVDASDSGDGFGGAYIIEDTTLVSPEDPVTKEQLNDTYPNAQPHQAIYAKNVGSGMYFIKLNDGNWIYIPVSLVN